MSKIAIGIGIDKGAGMDPDTAEFIARAGLTNPTHISAVDRLVSDLKGAGLWAKMTAIYPIVGGTALAHSKNLKSNTFNITWINGPTHNASGVAGNGTTQYGDTGMITSVLDVTNIHGSTYCSGPYVAPGDAFGAWDGGERIFGLEGPFGNAPAAFIMDLNHLSDGRLSSSAIDGLNLTVITRRSLSDAEGYSRGVSVGTKNTVLSSVLPAAQNIYVLARNDGGTAAWWLTQTFKWWSFGSGLTSANVSALQTIVQRFQTTLGRQIA